MTTPEGMDELQRATVDAIDADMDAHKAANTRIVGARRALGGHHTFNRKKGTSTVTPGAVEVNGDHYLQMRRLLGLPDPDGREWGQRMLRYHVGQLALIKASENPTFTVDQVPTRLREWLRHPIWDRPATDSDLTALLHATHLDQEGEEE